MLKLYRPCIVNLLLNAPTFNKFFMFSYGYHIIYYYLYIQNLTIQNKKIQIAHNMYKM